jgi:IS30 family transposase
LQQKYTIPEIAQSIEKDAASVRREISRNSIEGYYNAELAQERAEMRRQRASAKIKGWVLRYIRRLMRLDHSPKEIAARLGRFHRIRLTAAAIYRFIWRNYEEGGSMWKLLRYCGARKRLRRYGRGQRAVQRRRRDQRRSIHDRGARIDNRREYGHWEMDLIEGKGRKRYLLVLIERKSRYLCAGLLEEKSSPAVARVAKRILKGLKVRSITTDNGMEFNNDKLIEETLGCPLYFADPYKSWQKGQVEHVNGLLRQYFPKNDSLEGASSRWVKRVVGRINRRLRESLKWLAPDELLEWLEEGTPAAPLCQGQFFVPLRSTSN